MSQSAYINTGKYGGRSTRNRFGVVHRQLGNRFASACGHRRSLIAE
jgi:hypothetical protein